MSWDSATRLILSCFFLSRNILFEKYIFNSEIEFINIIIVATMHTSWCRGTSVRLYTRHVVGSIPTQGNEILIIFIRGQSWRSGTKCDCKTDWLRVWFDPHSRRWNNYLNLYFHFFALVSRLSAALSSATQHAMPSEFGRKWRTECVNTRFPLPTLLCAGYSVKLIFFFIIFIS